jgi:hypothetical protein
MVGVGARSPRGTGARLIAGLLCSVALAVGIGACGGGGSRSSTTRSAAAAATTSSTSAQTTPAAATTSPAKHAAHHKKQSKSGGSTKTTSSGGVSPSAGTSSKKSNAGSSKHSSTGAGTTSSPTHTSSGSSGGSSGNANGSGSSGSKKSTNSKPKPKSKAGPKPVAPLPGPVVAASAGGMRASLHGQGHAPTAGKLWHYSVLATDPGGRALSGKVDTEFVFSGQVVGRESPPTHPLTNGRLDDKVTFPAQSVGIPLTFRVVVHTSAGTVTLNWPVKVHH